MSDLRKWAESAGEAGEVEILHFRFRDPEERVLASLFSIEEVTTPIRSK